MALLQEAVLHDDAVSDWGAVMFRRKYKQFGCAVLVREGGYQLWEPSAPESWLGRIGGAACVAQPTNGGPWPASVHSDADSFEKINRKYPTWYAALPTRDGVLRCNETRMWEIEVIALELRQLLGGSRFVLGGDLNSALLFDEKGGDENDRLFANLGAQGYVDVRPRHSAGEVQTYFKPGCRPLQLDHVFADRDTESRVISWRVLPEPAETLAVSDHAPIEIVIDAGQAR